MRSVTLLLLAGLWAAAPAGAQEDLRGEMQRCAAINNAAERLFCFDTLASGAVRMPAEPAPQAARRQPPSPPAQAAGQRPQAPTSQATSAATGDDSSDFGLEMERVREGAQSISSRYDGTFTGWDGNTEFRLENGQVWRQAESDRLAFRAERPMITIRRGWFGVYYLKVEGSNKQIRVKRIE